MEPQDHARFAGWQDRPGFREWHLWGYIDARDAAQAVRRSLHVDMEGAEHFIIANANTVMTRDSAGLMAEIFPGGSELRGTVKGRETLLSIDKARRVLGYAPEHDWPGPNG